MLHLEEKIWYRFFKVIYIGLLVIILFFVNGLWYEENLNYAKDFLLGDLAIIIVFLLIRGAFFYIVLGRFFSKQDR